MSLAGQRADPDRYSLVPRTLSFVFHNDQVLLLKAARGHWAGLFNGIGGHLEQGEDPLSAATRELREESGLTRVVQRLAGVVTVDTGTRPGVGLFVFVAQAGVVNLVSGGAGKLEWVPVSQIEAIPHVEDLPYLVRQAARSLRDGEVFFASYRFTDSGELIISPNAQGG